MVHLKIYIAFRVGRISYSHAILDEYPTEGLEIWICLSLPSTKRQGTTLSKGKITTPSEQSNDDKTVSLYFFFMSGMCVCVCVYVCVCVCVCVRVRAYMCVPVCVWSDAQVL